jgi:predicted enzyme related to lactoylglutathione lyase
VTSRVDRYGYCLQGRQAGLDDRCPILIVEDLPAEVARLRAAGGQFRNNIVTGPGGSQTLLMDPSGNLVELFRPARH